VYRILISWNYKPPEERTKENPNPAPTAPPDPTIDVQPSIIEEYCTPSPSNTVDHNGNPTTGLDNLNNAQLTHLDFVPYLPDKPLQDPYPTIVATFATLHHTSQLVFDPSHRYQNASSVVCRWHFRFRAELSQPLFAVFDELKVQKMRTPDGKLTRAADVQRVSTNIHQP
jgi:hypothetical protein